MLNQAFKSDPAAAICSPLILSISLRLYSASISWLGQLTFVLR